MVSEIAYTLVQPFDHGQEVLAQNEVVTGTIEHTLGGLEESEEGESVSELGGVGEEVCL